MVNSNRLNKHYRVMWDQNAGQYNYYNPPLKPERVAQAHFGFFAGRQPKVTNIS